MRVLSRMALAMAAGAWIFPASLCLAEVDKPTPAPKAEKPADAPTTQSRNDAESQSPGKGRKVELRLVIGGLGVEGCDVEVKPGNAACRFKKKTSHVPSNGKVTLEIREVELRGVDRNCTFAIVLREKGQEPKTVYRGFRLAADADADDSTSERTESFTCYMSSPSKVAGLAREGRVIR